MFKYFLAFTFFMFSTFALADIKEIKLQKEYGQDLTKAPFFLRFTYYKEYNKDWSSTLYEDRLGFLENFEALSAQEKEQEKADAKMAQEAEKNKLLEKKLAEKKEKDRLRAEAAEELAEKKAEEDRQKSFNDLVNQQKKEITDMERASMSNN